MGDVSKMVTVGLGGFGVLCGAAVLGLLLAFPIMWCWNFVMPYLFGWPILTWGKAWCLMFLANMLIKSTFSTS